MAFAMHAKTFFGKEPDRLTIEEAAVLVGMLNAPMQFITRDYFRQYSQDSRNTVINQMVKNNYLKQGEANKIKPQTQLN